MLKPGGRLELLDFAGPQPSQQGVLARLIHSHDRLKGNADWRVRSLMAEAGFSEPAKIGEYGRLFGRVAYYQAAVPTWFGL